MTLEEAIIHCEAVAETNERICTTELSVGLPDIYNRKDEVKKCAEEHRQLAEWLKDYKRLLEQQLCNDAISREPFMDSTICEGISCNECAFNRKDKGGCILEERVMKLPSVTPQPNKWTPVSEKPNDGEYLVTRIDIIGRPVVAERHFKNGKGWCENDTEYGWYTDNKVTAWMPLPEPYKAEGSGE